MAIIAWFLDTKIGRFIALIGSAVGFILFAWWRGKMQGSSQAKQQIAQKDAQNANQVHVKAEQARASVNVTPSNVDSQLQSLGALRSSKPISKNR